MVSLVLSIPALRSVRLGVAGPDRVKVGEKAELLLMGSCDMPMPPFRGRIFLRDLRTGEKRPYQEETGFIPKNCGGYAVEIEKARILDYLGLFSFPARRRRNGRLLVPPVKCPLDRLPEELDLPPLRWKPSTQRLGENHELRPYRPGDSLNTVHWKLSAKMGALTVREAMEPQKRTACLTLNLWGSPQELDKRLGQLLWLGAYLLERDMDPLILCMTGEGPVRLEPHSEKELEQAVDSLLCLPQCESAALPEPVGASWHYCLGGGAMKKRIWDILWAVSGGLILSLAVIRCYGTVYGMEIPWVTLLRCLLVAGVLAGLLLPPRRGTEIVLCLSAVVLGYLLRLPQTLSQLKSLLVYASVSLHEVYHWGYFIFPGHTPGTVEIPVAVYGSAVLLSFARCVIRRRGPVLPLLLTVPVLILCVLIPNVEPNPWDVFAILATLGLLILTSGTRKNSAIQGRMLTAMAAVPVLLTALLLVLRIPRRATGTGPHLAGAAYGKGGFYPEDQPLLHLYASGFHGSGPGGAEGWGKAAAAYPDLHRPSGRHRIPSGPGF